MTEENDTNTGQENAQTAAQQPGGDAVQMANNTTAPAPDMETTIRRTIMAEAGTLRPDWALAHSESVSYSDLPDDLLTELAALFSDPADLDLYTVVAGEIASRAAAKVPANENVRTVNDRGHHIA